MSSPGFKFATAQMFDLQDDNGNPPQKLALRAPQLAFMLMWVSGSTLGSLLAEPASSALVMSSATPDTKGSTPRTCNVPTGSDCAAGCHVWA